ncbi:MAG: hypothetical protein IJQ86_03435 [Spirochaetia bacterium]|nr:hypothetical protein [Spirochaetia bacterium]
MDKFDFNSLTKEQIELASKCKTPEELIELAKKAGVELTIEQAEAYLNELQDAELDETSLDKVAGGCNLRGQTKWSHSS